jgi:glycine cleavage system H protein
MSFIEKFLGKRVQIPEDRRYYPEQGLWAKSDGKVIIVGLTEPALVLAGGLTNLDWLVSEGESVTEGQAVAFAVTGKILYLNTPLAGTIHINAEAKENPSIVSKEPYGLGWLFRLDPDGDTDHVLQSLVDDQVYVESLKGTEGFKNPEGLKGGVSGICKAVYSGIREQKT